MLTYILKRIVYTMPIMLGVISVNLSAGLGLYWSAGNVISFVQQILVNRSGFGREMREEIEAVFLIRTQFCVE